MTPISKKIIDRVNELTASTRAQRVNAWDQAEAYAHHLRYEADLCRLDGKKARSQALNRLARTLDIARAAAEPRRSEDVAA